MFHVKHEEWTHTPNLETHFTLGTPPQTWHASVTLHAFSTCASACNGVCICVCSDVCSCVCSNSWMFNYMGGGMHYVNLAWHNVNDPRVFKRPTRGYLVSCEIFFLKWGPIVLRVFKIVYNFLVTMREVQPISRLSIYEGTFVLMKVPEHFLGRVRGVTLVEPPLL